MLKFTSNYQCNKCTGWVHKDVDGKVNVPTTCLSRIECFDKKNGVEAWCLSLEKWNVAAT